MRQRRYPSDTTNAEWALIEPLLPEPACETSRGGRPEKHPRREIVDAIRYVSTQAASGGPFLRISRRGGRFGGSWPAGPLPG